MEIDEDSENNTNSNVVDGSVAEPRESSPNPSSRFGIKVAVVAIAITLVNFLAPWFITAAVALLVGLALRRSAVLIALVGSLAATAATLILDILIGRNISGEAGLVAALASIGSGIVPLLITFLAPSLLAVVGAFLGNSIRRAIVELIR